MKIGLVSDTHVPSQLAGLPSSLLKGLRGVDAILHAGDLVALSVLDTLSEIAPVTAVAGNMDPPEVTAHLGSRRFVELGGRRIGLQHGHQTPALQSRYIALPYDAPEFELFFQAMAAQLPRAEIVVFGHFHVPLVKTWHDRLFVNPGAVAPSRTQSSYALLTIDGSEATVQHFTIEDDS